MNRLGISPAANMPTTKADDETQLRTELDKPGNDTAIDDVPTDSSSVIDNVVYMPGNTNTKTTPSRPHLQSVATTAVSRTDIHIQTEQDGSREAFASTAAASAPPRSIKGYDSIRRLKGFSGSEAGDTASYKSLSPTLDTAGDNESQVGEFFPSSLDEPAFQLLRGQGDGRALPYPGLPPISHADDGFELEFKGLRSESEQQHEDENLVATWRGKRKHFFILSAAGKPIYSRHGDESLTSSIIGVVQTIISSFEASNDHLRFICTRQSRLAIVTRGPLHLVAVTKLDESEAQLRNQLDALYMQILSTLTLPTLNSLFAHRPSTDLRRPLQGTEVLLSALADSFTRGSPAALLSAVECFRIRKAVRQLVNDTFLRFKSDMLLYGLLVAGGRLVSVARPRQHSLHPSDLQLIFNMLFEADGIKSGGGENWIPLCLPGFNKDGFLYMYVSFLGGPEENRPLEESIENLKDSDEAIAILLVSASKEAFYAMRKMRNGVTKELEDNGCMSAIKASVRRGRLSPADIVPGTIVRHFLYKSKSNVQFVMPSYEPHFSTLLERRRLFSQYQALQASVHSKNSNVKIEYCVNSDSVSLAWITPIFELYCIAGPNVGRKALAQEVNKIVQWVKHEEARLFIVGGAVF